MICSRISLLRFTFELHATTLASDRVWLMYATSGFPLLNLADLEISSLIVGLSSAGGWQQEDSGHSVY